MVPKARSPVNDGGFHRLGRRGQPGSPGHSSLVTCRVPIVQTKHGVSLRRQRAPIEKPMSPHRFIPALLPLLVPLTACSDYLLSGGEDEQNPPDDDATPPPDDDVTPQCPEEKWPAEEVSAGDECVPNNPSSSFTPIVEWEYGGFDGCLSLPVVGDLDGDGSAEVVFNNTSLFSAPGTLVVLNGEDGTVQWSDGTADLGFGASPALADLDGDGQGEIVGVREYATSIFFGTGDYTVVAWSADGEELWESAHFVGDDFEYATGVIVSDMDHDGSPEIIVGRVILHPDGTTRGVGTFGNGTSGLEGAIPAVADLDLDGTEEVIAGNSIYGPDGNVLWYDGSVRDGFVSVGNLDDDPEGEFVVVSSNLIHVHNHDGTYLWGPTQYDANSTLTSPAIGDLDMDGLPEIVFAGANRLYALHRDGSALWDIPVIDESGATGASIFDFGGDGRPEVVYEDEVEVLALDGPTGDVVFSTHDHTSNTMFDYPVIADVDGDDQAEIVVCHNGYSSAISVYGDPEGLWIPARALWNQHAYGISNINDDLSVPEEAIPSFVDSNTWHSGLAVGEGSLTQDLEAQILSVCVDECREGILKVTVRVRNRGLEEAPAGALLALYGEEEGGTSRLLVTSLLAEAIPLGFTSPGQVMVVDSADLTGIVQLRVEVDDDGTGTGVISECSESNNSGLYAGKLCPVE